MIAWWVWGAWRSIANDCLVGGCGGLDAWRSIANDCWVGGWGTGCLEKYS